MNLDKMFLSALEELCPGSGFQVSTTGEVTRASTLGCSGYCDHRAACNLIDALITAPGTTVLSLSGHANGFGPETIGGLPGGTVYWKPDVVISDENQCGGRRVDPIVMLAHEMVHALQAQLNTLDGSDPKTENDAVRGENQVRLAHCEPARIKYGATLVPDYDSPYLDSKDLRSCACATQRSPIEQLKKDIQCLTHKALYCLLERFDAVAAPSFKAHSGADQLSTDLGGAGPVVEGRVKVAEETREISPHAAYIHALAEDSFVRDPFTVCLESVGLGGVYGAILVFPSAAGLQVVTNRSFVAGTEHFVASPTDLLEYTFSANSIFVNRIQDLSFAEGVGGQANEFGGAVEFLSLNQPQGLLTNTALYGYRYPAFDGNVTGPPGIDAPRWAAVNDVYDAVRDLMLTPSLATQVIARRVSGTRRAP